MKKIIAGFAALLAASVVLAQSRLTNVSVRSVAGSGAETLIVGFAVTGSGEKSILLRGIGPSLGAFGVSGFVVNPELRLFSGPTIVGLNDDWGGRSALGSAFASVGAFALPAASRDSALLQTLQPGAYSAHLVAGSGPGIALVECYAADPFLTPAYITNVSARSTAGTGANVLTVGFAVTGPVPKPLLIRGVGPTLAIFGVTGVLADPRLRLFNSAGVQIGDNDDWITAGTTAAVFSAAGAFALPAASRDALLFLGLPAGTYTAQVSGAGSTTGTALIEVYEVNEPSLDVITLQPVTNPAALAPVDPGAGTPSTGADAVPRVISQSRPAYPFELRRVGVTGEVFVDFYVKSDGTVANAVAIRATDSRFATAALAAVRAWLFVPGRNNGRLVTTHLQVPIIFTLDS